jgi:DNA-binding IclR family transcriptional regulator
MPTKAKPDKPKRSKPRKPAIKDSGFSTPSLDRALGILECLGRSPQGLSLSQLAEAMGLSVNFVYRVTQSLTAHGYLLRDAEKRFRVGAKLLSLCQPVCEDVPLAEAALPAMRWLSEQTGEAAHLGMLDGAQGVVLERVIGTALVKFYAERGTRFALHTSAPGKCILAFTPEEEREKVIGQMTFERFQPWTIGSAEEFCDCLKQVRREGFATDLSEHLEGHHCLGAPILSGDGTAVAAIWITGPGQRLTEERVRDLAPTMKEAGRMASAAFTPNAILRR